MWWFVVLWYGSFELVSVWYCWVEWQLWRDTLSHWCNVFFLFLSNRHRVDQHDNRGDRHHLLLHWQVWKETQTKWKTEEANHTDISRWVCFRVVCELWATQFTHTHIFKQLTDVFEYLCQRPSHISPTYPHKHTHKHKHNTPPSHPHIHTRSSQLPATVHKCTQMHTTHTPEPLVSLTHRRTLQPHADVTLQLSLSQPPPTSDNTQITITSICFILFRLQNLERHQTQHRLPVQHRTTTISTSTTLTSLVRGEDDLDLVQHHQTHQPARHQSPVQWNVSHTHNNSYSTVHTSSHIFTLISSSHIPSPATFYPLSLQCPTVHWESRRTSQWHCAATHVNSTLCLPLTSPSPTQHNPNVHSYILTHTHQQVLTNQFTRTRTHTQKPCLSLLHSLQQHSSSNT